MDTQRDRELDDYSMNALDFLEGDYVLATLVNMRRLYLEHGNRLVAVSPNHGEQFSANPGDYFSADDSFVLRDDAQEPCVLALRSAEYQFIAGEVSGRCSRCDKGGLDAGAGDVLVCDDCRGDEELKRADQGHVYIAEVEGRGDGFYLFAEEGDRDAFATAVESEGGSVSKDEMWINDQKGTVDLILAETEPGLGVRPKGISHALAMVGVYDAEPIHSVALRILHGEGVGQAYDVTEQHTGGGIVVCDVRPKGEDEGPFAWVSDTENPLKPFLVGIYSGEETDEGEMESVDASHLVANVYKRLAARIR